MKQLFDQQMNQIGQDHIDDRKVAHDQTGEYACPAEHIQKNQHDDDHDQVVLHNRCQLCQRAAL